MKKKSIQLPFILVFLLSCVIPATTPSTPPTSTPEGLWLSTEFIKDYTEYPVLPNGVNDIYSGAWSEAAGHLNISLKPDVKTTKDWKSQSFIQEGATASGLTFIVPASNYYIRESTPMSEVPMGEAENFSVIRNFNKTGKDVVVIGARIYNFDGTSVILPYLIEATNYWNKTRNWNTVASCIGKGISGSTNRYAERSILAPVDNFGTARFDSFDGIMIKEYYSHDADARNTIVNSWLATGLLDSSAENIPWSPMCSYVG